MPFAIPIDQCAGGLALFNQKCVAADVAHWFHLRRGRRAFWSKPARNPSILNQRLRRRQSLQVGSNFASDNPGATSHIQNPLTWFRVRRLNKNSGARSKKRGHHVVFVALSWISHGNGVSALGSAGTRFPSRIPLAQPSVKIAGHAPVVGCAKSPVRQRNFSHFLSADGPLRQLRNVFWMVN